MLFLCRLLADYIGHINVVVLYSVISGLACLFIWTFATTFATLLLFSIVYGFFGSAFITLSMLYEKKNEMNTCIFTFLICTSTIHHPTADRTWKVWNRIVRFSCNNRGLDAWTQFSRCYWIITEGIQAIWEL